jgi:hypothetical protein
MLFMIIEKFKDGDPLPVYRRFRDQGRQAPDGLKYIWTGFGVGPRQRFDLSTDMR